MTLVHSTYMEFVRQQAKAHDPEWIAAHRDKSPKLFISSLGFCKRKAFFEAVKARPNHPWYVDVTHPHDDYLLLKFRDGNVGEEATAQALAWMYGADLTCQFQVEHDIWSGRPDFLIQPDTIVEHKVTAASNFVRKGGIPYVFQCFQVLAYRRLLIPQLGRELHARLYYRGYPGNWAEFEVFDCDSYIEYEGYVNGKPRSGRFDANLSEEMVSFEAYWLANGLPPRYDTPLSEQFGCARETKAGVYPDCPYFSHCWPELPKEGPFDEDLVV